MRKELIFAIIWGFLVGVVLVPTGLTIYDGTWWIAMLALNLFGNFVISPVIFDK